MNITINATNIDLTSSLREHAEEKIGSLEKYFDNIIKADIDIGKRSNHHQKGKIYYAEVNIKVPNKTLRVVKDAEDLYKAVDKVKDHFKIELQKMKEKMRDKNRKMIREQKEYQG